MTSPVPCWTRSWNASSKPGRRASGPTLPIICRKASPKDFDDLLRILDSEIRLITPTDPEGKEGGEPAAIEVGVPALAGLREDRLKPVLQQAPAKYYQLTHDYLVPSLRDWLTRKQKETRRGRAELLLADRAGCLERPTGEPPNAVACCNGCKSAG